MRKIWALAALAAGIGFTSMASAASSFISDANAKAGTITIAANGLISVTAPATGNYDGVEDVVYNVVNLSNVTVSTLAVTGLGISGFDQDGIDNYANTTGGTIGTYGTVIDRAAYSPAYTTSFHGPTGGNAPGSDYTGYSNGVANTYTSFTADPTATLMDTVNIQFGGGGLGTNGTGFISFELPAAANGQITVGQVVPLPASAWAGLALLGLIGAVKLSKRTSLAI